MALAGTHLRFAHDLIAHLPIQDLTAYYTGTLYPDARYYTGITRDASHGSHCPHDPFADGLTDFERGWAVHLLYDETVGLQQQAMIPSSYPRTQARGGLDDWWAYLTSLKTIEDQQSLQVQGVLGLFAYVTCLENPNHESQEHLAAYYRLIREVYATTPTLDGYGRMMASVHVPVDRVAFLLQTIRQIENNTDIRLTVLEMYPRQLEKTLRGA